jgi:predicted ArsR family transcriptional regulator
MDFFDVKILKALRSKDSVEFYDILSKVDFSHNTLKEHLNKLVDQRLVERVKRSQSGPGRPTYLYRLPVEVKRSLSSLINPELGLVSLSFDILRRVCRHEKGGYCKEIRGQCKAINCPQIMK